jgi:hypothetical protein
MTTRRRTLTALVAAAAALGAGSSAATAAGSPQNLSPAPGSAPTEAGPTVQFVQDAERGTLLPAGRRGEYWLTLRGAKSRTLWFENRPGDLKGTLPNARVLNLFYGKPGIAPPNAAVDVWDPRRRDDVVMGLKFLWGSWNARARTLRYRVRTLRAAPSAPGSRRTTDVDTVLPRRFEEAAVYIDDLGDVIEGNRCRAQVTNNTLEEMRWVGHNKPPTDSWTANPTRSVPGRVPNPWVEPGWSAGEARWETLSGWLRGCYNRVTYAGPTGSVTIGVDDPLRGPNNWACTATGTYVCTGPVGEGGTGGSVLYGPNLFVWFFITKR